MKRRSDLQELAQKYNHLRMRLKGAEALLRDTQRNSAAYSYRGPNIKLSEETKLKAYFIRKHVEKLYSLVVKDWEAQRIKLKIDAV